MRVCVDEAGEHHAAAEIEFFGAARVLDGRSMLVARADRRDAIAVDEDRPVTNEAQLGKAASAARNGTA